MIRKIQRKIGFVPVHIANLSLEEVVLPMGTYSGEASFVYCHNIDHTNRSLYEVSTILGEDSVRRETVQIFEDYLRDKFKHLTEGDRKLFSSVLRK